MNRVRGHHHPKWGKQSICWKTERCGNAGEMGWQALHGLQQRELPSPVLGDEKLLCPSVGWVWTRQEATLQRRSWDCSWETSCACGQPSPGMAAGKRVAILPQYLVLVKSCLGSIMQENGVPWWRKSSGSYPSLSGRWSMWLCLGESCLSMLGKRWVKQRADFASISSCLNRGYREDGAFWGAWELLRSTWQ